MSEMLAQLLPELLPENVFIAVAGNIINPL